MGYKDNGVFAFLVILHNLAQQHISAHWIKTCGWFVKNENLVRPMLNGRKSLPAALAAEARDGRKASIALGVTLLAVAIAVVVTVFQWSKLFPG